MTAKPLLYLAEKGALPAPIQKLARVRTVAAPKHGTDGGEALTKLFEDAGGMPCDVIATGLATESALRLAKQYPDMIDKLVIDTPLVENAAQSVDSLESLAAQLLIVIGDRAPQTSAQNAVALKRKFDRSHLAYVYDATDTVVDSQPERYETVVFDFLERGVAFVLKPDKTKSPA
jgi:hypothetical protein